MQSWFIGYLERTFSKTPEHGQTSAGVAATFRTQAHAPHTEVSPWLMTSVFMDRSSIRYENNGT